jgi:hypothetical protein
LEDEMLCCTMYLDKDWFFTLKNKLHLPAFFVFCPFSLPFFQGEKKVRHCIRICYLQVLSFFFLYTSTWRMFFFVAIVKLWNMNKGVQYDMSCCYMIFAMLPRDIPGVSMHTLRCSLLRCMCFFGHVL